VELPAPGADEVLVETLYSCISPGTELRCLSGKQAGAGTFPFVPGYASIGRVIKAGASAGASEGSTGFFQGSEYAPGLHRLWGGHMSHAVLHGAAFQPVPEGVDLVQAAAAKLGSIPYHGLRLCHPLPGEKIAIIGLGAIGHMAAKLYTAAGAFVVAADVSARRVAQAGAAGVNAVPTAESLKQTFAPFFPAGADVVVDCTGAPAVLPRSIEVCRDLPWSDLETRGPRLVLQGSYADSFTVPYGAVFQKEMQFIVPRSEQDRDRVILFDMIRRNAISLTSIISDVRNPAEAQKTYDQLRDPDTDLLTVVFKWT